MSISEIIKNRRTARNFNDKKVSESDLINIISLARLSPSAANLQPLKYGIIVDENIRKKMYPLVRYAGYIKDWNPTFEQSPKAFIAIFCDTEVVKVDKCECDAGIAMMAITLVAEEKGLSSCIIGAFDKKEVAEILGVDKRYSPVYLIGLGYSDGKSGFFESNEEVKYRLNQTGGFDVPKRRMEDILVVKK